MIFSRLHPVTGLTRRKSGRLASVQEAGFTLVEVILAIGIAVGLLVAAVWFYRQAAEYRNQLLNASERLATIRLVTDQLANDLRTVQADGRHAFTGDSNVLQFAKSVFPQPSGTPESDLHRVSYRAIINSSGTNSAVTGVTREEEPLMDTPVSVAGSSNPTPFAETEVTNRVEVPMTDAIRHLSFRYWDGSVWRDTWNSFDPPPGVEVTLASEPLGLDPGVVDTDVDRFRRVIVIPAGLRVANRRQNLGSMEEPSLP